MFKKLLTLIAVVAVSAFAANAQAPCTPDPIYADSSAGIWPDSAAGLPDACLNQLYEAIINVKTLTDTTTTFSGFDVQLKVKGLKILDIAGEPAGFTVAANYNATDGAGAYWLNGGTDPNWVAIQACAKISADANSVNAAANGGPLSNGVYPIDVYVDVLAKGTPIPASYTWVSSIGTAPYGASIKYSSYRIVVKSCTIGVEENLASNKFDVAQSFPNPANGITSIPFNTVKEENVTMKVYSMLGSLVYEHKVRSNVGNNVIHFDASKLSAGVYIYTVTNGNETVTRKMTIN